MAYFPDKIGKKVHSMNTSKVIHVIKTELKKNKITYKQVGRRLKMTEAGIKKILNKDDISLKKIEAICDLLNISLLEILKIAENENVDAVRFSEKQIQYFLTNPHFFHFFMKLAYEQKSPRKIQEEFHLSAKSLMLYLKKLEEIDLIRRHPNDHMQIIGGIPLALNTQGTELERFKYDIALRLLESVNHRDEARLQGAGFYLSDEQQAHFIEKIQSLVLDFSSLSRSNRKKPHDEKFKDCTFMSYNIDQSMFNRIVEIN